MGKINLKPVVNFAIGAVKCIVYGTLASLPYLYLRDDDEYDYYDDYYGTYDEAMRVISHSDMFSSHKKEAMIALKQNQNCSYYKAIIAIVESDMFSSGKLETIKEISDK